MALTPDGFPGRHRERAVGLGAPDSPARLALYLRPALFDERQRRSRHRRRLRPRRSAPSTSLDDWATPAWAALMILRATGES